MPDSISIGVAYRDQKIDGGLIENTAIGTTTKAAGAFTTLNATGATTLDGSVAIGNASVDAVGFYGATAVTQRASSAFAAVATTAVIASSISSSCFGFTSAQATNIILLVNELRAAAVALGLIAT